MCADFELKAVECIEYYGAKQGMTACKDWYDDYIECQTGAKQWLRIRAMFKKRHIDNHLEYLQVGATQDYHQISKFHFKIIVQSIKIFLFSGQENLGRNL